MPTKIPTSRTDDLRRTHNPQSSSSLPKRLIGESLRKMGYSLRRIDPKTKLVCKNFPGWFSVEEAETLYLLAATSSASRILEIGHFLGRSTSALCEGIRDGGSTVEFNSYDLGFKNADEFIAHFKLVHDTASSSVPKEYEELVYSKNKTTSELAKFNLERFHLDHFVNLVSGDFTLLDKTRYGLIFCDAVHDHKEIMMNLPHVIAASEDDCVWAFHDMSPANVTAVVETSSARFISVIDTLGIFHFHRQTGTN
jgi:hypothetical protein